ncbi:hypothetical protein HYT55_00405 [Candidatus Woesearchaeota archaeon]|nr:hypothetical protein [Candidatus Woesearchaeota archaeon]
MAENGIKFFGAFFAAYLAVNVGTCTDSMRGRDIQESLRQARKEIQYVREDVQRLGNPAMDSNDSLDLRVENVLGGPELESFYTIEGKRVYVTVDGRPVEEYFPLQAEKGTE